MSRVHKLIIISFQITMATLFYRLEAYDLLIFWLLTLIFGYFIFRSILPSAILSSIAVVVCIIVYACFAVPAVDPHRHNLFVSSFKAGAHRGLALDAPENTMSAFRLSKELRADILEFDLEFTSDWKAVIIHDDTVDRTTDGTGRIDQMTWKEAQRLNAAAKFTDGVRNFSNEHIPTLEETLKLGLELGFKMIIDVKNTGQGRVVPAITQLFIKYPELYNTTAVSSFYPQVAYLLKRADPYIITGHTWRPGFFVDKLRDRALENGTTLSIYWELLGQFLERVYLWSMHNWVWKWTGINLVLARRDMITKEYMELWRQRNIQVLAWTVNDLAEKKYYLHTLKCPFLTDRLSDLQDELVKGT